MKTCIKFSLLLLILVMGWSCKQKVESKTEVNELPVEEVQEIDGNRTNKLPSFQKTLSLQGITFQIKTEGEGSIRKLTIAPEGLSMDASKVEMETDGAVMNAEIEDLNSDGYPEILIYTTSAGSGSYGNVIAYSVNGGKSISQISFPEIEPDSEAAKGYMGHDEFAIAETTLLRRFPIYEEGDSNASPTGNIRQIQYKLVDGEASRKFVVDQVILIPKN
ncbi:PliI family lysozyme inhibitor of I-type lysozyme [Namhaeicola litoreus]|uniref:PliI family lysozyme inhibitor of I-type lysozyme n=1 Tax=Namhaeicola litoreus TaxID=1052145 RepID=A0ABW3XXV5_9FLAO